MSFLRTINQEIEDYRNKVISIVPGLTWNQRDTIEKIHFYYNSKFQSGEIDDEGDKKYFFNITKNPCKVFSKAVDFDTKNIRLLTSGGGDPTKTWFLERDLKYWMRDKQFGKTLNRIFRELPVFGSVVLKVVKGNLYFVDLRNFIVTQSADSLDASNFITEIHNYSIPEFRKVGKEMKWGDKVNEAIEKFREMKGASHIRVYERYGEVPEEKNGQMTYPYKRCFYADVGVDEYDQFGRLVATHQGVELSCEDWEGHPYREFHAEKMPGRWLGIGVVETLFEPQVKQNETANLESKMASFLAILLFQTRDPNFNRNLRSDAKSGDVLFVDSELTQVSIGQQNGAFFNEQTQKWLRNRDELTFSYDVVQGERLPAGTPLGSAQIAMGQTLSYFEQIQEDIAMNVKELIYKDILPQFEKDMSAEHVMRLVGQDLDAYAEMVKNELVLKELIRQVVSGRPFPTNQDRDTTAAAVTESIKQGKEKLLTVPKDFYKNAKYDVDIDITGESVDTRVRYATKFALLQAITADPTMTTDPLKKKMLYSMAEDGGVNPIELFGADTMKMEDMMPQVTGRAGGGVSAPNMNPMQGQQTQTV